MSTAITLFGLVTKPNDTRPIFSSFVWMIKADFAILGVTYIGVNKSFSEIRYLFEDVMNPNVTIPTITIKVGDEYITGSWKIAQWLSKCTVQRDTLPIGRRKGSRKFFEIWINKL
ncbi:hypothetical protein I315_06704 [Cryptococcus gattii Ru294]|uniref:GST N-terminal domain-containing protein n=1 Tax=Cryptococcus gattii EJB2 TaxID=1296103 RepID=A0ABR5BQS5_9TREE|nr:hypothetical protein I315_06704 [Cryptococcus gattii Ru294]KIR77998.1 hypothetical protein I306_05006 [Cryptococcus gattii EJB2]KIY36928.1 hypothetical protein I305_00016 [Cryptococcus gattii E566]KJE00602.1 hypothetical protein I311_05797 [Cryptococcus gattii NT-10]